jgi:hypothetical protein
LGIASRTTVRLLVLETSSLKIVRDQSLGLRGTTAMAMTRTSGGQPVLALVRDRGARSELNVIRIEGRRIESLATQAVAYRTPVALTGFRAGVAFAANTKHALSIWAVNVGRPHAAHLLRRYHYFANSVALNQSRGKLLLAVSEIGLAKERFSAGEVTRREALRSGPNPQGFRALAMAWVGDHLITVATSRDAHYSSWVKRSQPATALLQWSRASSRFVQRELLPMNAVAVNVYDAGLVVFGGLEATSGLNPTRDAYVFVP